jgi:hypothetical protein
VEMSCQAFGNLLQQYGNRNIITDVCCLEVEVVVKVECKDGSFSASLVPKNKKELENSLFCCKNSKEELFIENPAVYLFLLGNEELARFLGYSYITYNKYWRKCPDSKEQEENFVIFKKLERFIENQNFEEYQYYIPLYVGSTGNFWERYNSFKNSLEKGKNSHVFGGKLHYYLKDLCQINKLYQYSMKMCLVVFYTNSEDKAKCIEYSIFNHNDFCKIFNRNQPKCPLKGNQQQLRQQLGNIDDEIIDAIKKLKSCP